MPRRPAARASIPRTRRCAGRSPRATTPGRRRSSSRTSPAASTTAPARSSCSCRRARRCSRSAATACTGCAAGSTTRRATAAPRRRTRRRPRSTRSRPRRSARCCPSLHAAQEENEILGVSDGTPGPDVPAALQPGAQAHDRRDARGPGPGVGRLGGVGAAPGLRRPRPSSTATTSSTRSPARSSSGRRSARPTAAGPSTAPSPPKGALLRFTRYRHGGGRGGNVAAGALSVLRSHAPRRRHGRPTREPANGGVDPEALEHARQRAAMEIRTRYRAVTAEDFEFLAGEASPRVARAVCVAAAGHRRPGRAAPRAAALSRPTARSRYERAAARRGAAAGGLGVPRRAPADRHDGAAAAVQLPRAVGRS